MIEARARLETARDLEDDAAYERANQRDTATAYEEYVRKFSGGRHVEEARERQNEAQGRDDDAAYERARARDTTTAYDEYLRRHPQGRHVDRAREQQEEVQRREDDAAYERAQAKDTAAGYQEYLRNYPRGRHVAEARRLEAEKDLLRPGRRFADCNGCPKMVVVPAGSYMMGSPESEEGRDRNEGPPHRVTISKPFAVGIYEVTFDEWDLCAKSGGCGGYLPPDGWNWGRGRRPVMDVDWHDVNGYVKWLSRKSGKRYRLLSEAEWEYVARAGTTTRYNTGTRISSATGANYYGETSRARTVPVGSFKPNRFGLYDVHGNVAEWVQDCWNDSYHGAPNDGSAWETGDCVTRVVRGGSYSLAPNWESISPWRSAARAWYGHHSRRTSALGFRVARTL